MGKYWLFFALLRGGYHTRKVTWVKVLTGWELSNFVDYFFFNGKQAQ
jgi:hypothetical protein